MRALMKASPEPGLEMRKVADPTVGPGELLVRVRAASICGSDLHIYKWNRWAESRIRPPLIIGHEFVGEVADIGRDVEGFHSGDLVTSETHIVCGHCYQCRLGQHHVCQNATIIGIDRPGAFAEYITIPAAGAWPTDRAIDITVACIQEPYGNAVHVVTSTGVGGQNVLVTGCGPIGLMAIGVSRAMGASRVFASEVSAFRRDLATKMGADVVLNPLSDDVQARIQKETGGIGADVVLEMSGAPSALADGLSSLRAGGKCAVFGLPSEAVPVDFSRDVIPRGISIHGIVGRRLFTDWYVGQALLQRGKVDLRQLVTHSFPLEEFDAAFRLGQSGECGKIAFIL